MKSPRTEAVRQLQMNMSVCIDPELQLPMYLNRKAMHITCNNKAMYMEIFPKY